MRSTKRKWHVHISVFQKILEYSRVKQLYEFLSTQETILFIGMPPLDIPSHSWNTNSSVCIYTPHCPLVVVLLVEGGEWEPAVGYVEKQGGGWLKRSQWMSLTRLYWAQQEKKIHFLTSHSGWFKYCCIIIIFLNNGTGKVIVLSQKQKCYPQPPTMFLEQDIQNHNRFSNQVASKEVGKLATVKSCQHVADAC